MKKALLIVLATFLIVAVIDFGVGMVSRRLIKNAPDAGLNQTNTAQALFNKTADVLILGPSTANHHYVSSLFKERLGLSCYNAGRDGHDVLYADMVFRAFLGRCTPRITVVDMNESMMNGSWVGRNKDLACFYGASAEVRKVLDADVLSAVDRVKMLSNLYRYNNTLEWIATAYLSNWGEGDGYFPMPVNDNAMTRRLVNEPFQPHATCVKYLDGIVSTCKEKGIRLVLCASPSLVYNKSGVHKWMAEYGRKHGIETMNYSNDSTYYAHPELFFDATHLNDNGARLFTGNFIEQLKPSLNHSE